jgi:spermidine/putrescine transport system substrate-binding protein
VSADRDRVALAAARRPSRRKVLALGAAAAALGAGLGRPARAATPGLRLLAPEAYGDKALLAALAGDGPPLAHVPLADDDQALAPLRPLGPTAGAAEKAARPALVVTAHPFPRGILWPEGVIDPLGKNDLANASPTNILPGTTPTTATLESGIEGRYRLGIATRFDLATVAIDRRRVSPAAVGDLGLAVLDEPALNGRYGLLADPRCLLASAMLYAGLDPFRLQLPSELRRFEAALDRFVGQAALVTPSAEELVAALVDGRIDAALPCGLRHIAPARRDGKGDLALAMPRRGPLAGRAAFYWLEMISLAAQSKPIAQALEIMGRIRGETVTAALARAGGGLAPAVGLLDPANAGVLDPAERQALDLERLADLVPLAVPMALVPERHRLQPLLDKALQPK